MGIKKYDKNKITERNGPDSELIMRYFKIPLCRNFHWNAETDQVKLRMNVGSNDTCQWQFGSKIGVWQVGFSAKGVFWSFYE